MKVFGAHLYVVLIALGWSALNWYYLKKRRTEGRNASTFGKVMSFYNVGAIIFGLIYAALHIVDIGRVIARGLSNT